MIAMKDRLMSFFRYLVFRERKYYTVDAAKKRAIYKQVTESYKKGGGEDTPPDVGGKP